MKTLKVICKESDKITSIIFQKCFNNNQRVYDYPDSVIIGLFEDMIGKAKSMITLIDAKSYFGIESISRGIFESYIYLSFILQNNTKLRARSYALSSKTSEAKFYKTISDPGRVGKKIREFIGIGIEDIKNIIEDEDKFLNMHTEYFQDVLKYRNEKNKWYDLDGKTTSIEQLCIKLDKQSEYELVYRLLSKEVHSNDVLNIFNIEEEDNKINSKDPLARVDIKNKKNEIDLPVNICSIYLMDAVNLICDYYNLKDQKRKFSVILGINRKLN